MPIRAAQVLKSVKVNTKNILGVKHPKKFRVLKGVKAKTIQNSHQNRMILDSMDSSENKLFGLTLTSKILKVSLYGKMNISIKIRFMYLYSFFRIRRPLKF